MNIIAAVDDNWAIGKNGQLLAHISKDMKRFKEITTDKTIIYGRKTLETFPNQKPLPNRTNIILTKNPNFKQGNCIICNSLNSVFEAIKNINEDNVFIIGGSSVYGQFLPFCDTFYITHILHKYKGTDAFFPDLSEIKDIKCVWKSDEMEEENTKFYFAKYERD